MTSRDQSRPVATSSSGRRFSPSSWSRRDKAHLRAAAVLLALTAIIGSVEYYESTPGQTTCRDYMALTRTQQIQVALAALPHATGAGRKLASLVREYCRESSSPSVRVKDALEI